MRLDSSARDRAWAFAPYHVCLDEHGHRMYRGDTRFPDLPTPPAPGANSATDKAARKACRGKLPLQPPAMDPEKNPHYRDDYHAWMKCMQVRGMEVHAIKPFGTGWTFDSGGTPLPADKRKKIEQDCKMEAFGDE